MVAQTPFAPIVTQPFAHVEETHAEFVHVSRCVPLVQRADVSRHAPVKTH